MKTEELRIKALNAAISYLIVDRWARNKARPLTKIVDNIKGKYGGASMFERLATKEDAELMNRVLDMIRECDMAVIEKREEAARLAREYIEAAEPGVDFFYPPGFVLGERNGLLCVSVSINGRPTDYPLNSDEAE